MKLKNIINQEKDKKKITINKIRTKSGIKIQWNKIKDMKLKNKIN